MHSLLEPLRDEPLPASSVDIGRAVADGRQRLRRRRLAAAVTVGCAVLGVAVGVTAATGRTYRTSQEPATTATPPAKTTAEAPAPAPASFDPLRLRLSTGWVPSGLERKDPVMATGTQQILWSEPVAVMQNPQRWVDVTIYAAGIEPWQSSVGQRTKEPTDPVNGAQAAWLVTGAHMPEALAWRWAPNAWAVASVREADESTQRAIARRVAESVRTDGNDPVLLPFTVKRPPAPLRLAMIEPAAQHPQYSVSLRFTLGGEPMTLLGKDAENVVTLSVTWVLPGYQNKDKPNRTLDGAKAAVHFESKDWGGITLYRDGYEVTLGVRTRALRQLIDEATAIAIVTSVTPVGTPTDRTHWTANPLQ
jgi:hypothetical protein